MNNSRTFAYRYADIETMRKAIIKLVAAKRLHREAMMVFTYLTDICLNKEKGDCFPRYASIAEGIGVSVDTVERVMQQMQKLGVLICKKVGMRLRKIVFLSPSDDLSYAPRTTAEQRTRTTAEQRSSTTAEQRSSNTIENLPTRNEHRGSQTHPSPSAGASHHSDPMGPHSGSTLKADIGSEDIDFVEATGYVDQVIRTGLTVPRVARSEIINLLACKAITEEMAEELLIARSLEVSHG